MVAYDQLQKSQGMLWNDCWQVGTRPAKHLDEILEIGIQDYARSFKLRDFSLANSGPTIVTAYSILQLLLHVSCQHQTTDHGFMDGSI